MCGIVAYIGNRKAFPILIEGLKRLEYRGYDSAGICLLGDELEILKSKGKVRELESLSNGITKSSTTGMAHTRWATHGKPNRINAHPHLSGNHRLAIVHNGIIENYVSLKKALLGLGHQFESETDTEILVHLIEEIQVSENISLVEAVRIALEKVVGAYAIVVMDKDDPDTLVGARKSSPLVVGIGDDEYFMASDATPIIQHTNKVIYLKDEEVVELNMKNGYTIKNLSNRILEAKVEEINLKLEELEKGGYDHFMLKEIYQQPETILESMRGRVNSEKSWIHLGGISDNIYKFDKINRIIIVACGTSWHAGLIAEYLFEELSRIPVEVEYASEFRYRNPILKEDDLVIVISQSGETADTLAALKLANEKAAISYGIVNVVGSSIARHTQYGSYIHAGPEIGVASTKSFTSQVTVLALMAIYLAHRRKTISDSYFKKMLVELEGIPKKVKKVLDDNDKIRYIASEIKNASNALYLGRGYNFPVALEGALKLKEISYIHAEGYPAAEMKHGPIALIDMFMPVIVLATNQSAYSKILSNIQEVKARKGTVIAIISEEDKSIRDIADYIIKIPSTQEPLSPLVSVIPLQLLAYHIAVMRGCDVDQPRNLAKSVTVE